jgi:hypothetical protein
MLMIDVGTVVQDFVVDSVAYGQQGAWFLRCSAGTHLIFATDKMIDGGMKLLCVECQREALARTEAAQLHIDLSEKLRTNMF